MTTRQKSPLAICAAYFASFLVMGLVSNSLGPLLPNLAAQTASSLDDISILFTAFSLGILIVSLAGGRLYDRFPGHPLMAAALGLMALVAFAIPLVHRLEWMSACWLLVGVSKGALDMGGNTLLVWLYRERSSQYLNGLHFFFGAGSFLSPIIIALVYQWGGGLSGSLWALAVLILPVIVYISTTSGPPVETSSKETRRVKTGAGLVLLIALFFFFYIGIELSFSGWIYTYALATGLSTPAMAAYLTSAFWGALTLSRLFFIPLAARFEPGTILLSALVGCLAGTGTILGFQQSPVAIWAGTLLMGFSMASIIPMSIAYAGRLMPISGQLTGWFFAGGSLGGMLLPWCIGQLFETYGPSITMVTILVEIFAACVVLFILFAYTRLVKTR